MTSQDIICSICIESFKPKRCLKYFNDTVTLPCNHQYHKDCIGMWLQEHTTCPICRNTVENTSKTTSDIDIEKNIEQNVFMDKLKTIKNNKKIKKIYYVLYYIFCC